MLQELQGLGGALSSEAAGCPEMSHAFMMTSGCWPYGVSRGSVIIFCKNSAESCYSVQGLKEAFGTDTRNTLLVTLLAPYRKGANPGKAWINPVRDKARKGLAGMPIKNFVVQRTHSRFILKFWTESSG